MWSTLWKSPLNLCSDFVFPSHRSDLILQLLLILRIFNDAGGLDIFQTFWDILMFNQTVGYKHFTLECIVKREREVYPDNSHSNIHFLFARIPYISTHFYVLLCILIQCKGITLSFFCVGRWGSLTTVKGNDFFFFLIRTLASDVLLENRAVSHLCHTECHRCQLHMKLSIEEKNVVFVVVVCLFACFHLKELIVRLRRKKNRSVSLIMFSWSCVYLWLNWTLELCSYSLRKAWRNILMEIHFCVRC